MTELLTAAQMRAIEQAAIESGEVTGLELMERAGAGVVEAIFEEWPELGARDRRYAAVLCGPGNNGGDGFVVARLLHERGWFCDLSCFGNVGQYSGDAAAALAGLPADLLPSYYPFEDAWRVGSAVFETEADLVIDAVFGIGLNRPLGDSLAEALCDDLALYTESDLGAKCVAIDIPSGLDADTGEVVGGKEGDAFRAHLTVTFHGPKRGHVAGVGPKHCGKVVVKDIGL